MPSTEFQLIHLWDFLHLIGRSVKQISLAAHSKNRRDTADVRGETQEQRGPEGTNEYSFEIE